MVKLRTTDDGERLDAAMEDLCQRHHLKLLVDGWTRKTFDVYFEEERLSKSVHVARIESLVLSNGEIRFFDDRARPFVEELGAILERDFGVREAVLIKERSPESY